MTWSRSCILARDGSTSSSPAATQRRRCWTRPTWSRRWARSSIRWTSARRASGASNGRRRRMVSRLVIAAPASGTGKTTLATGLVAALAARGTRVAPFKVGPDYIDPGYGALAAGRVGRNLDPFLVGEERIAPLFAHGAAGADIGIVEGVM